MAIDGYGQNFLGPLLTDDVLIEDLFDLARRRNLCNGLGDLSLFVLSENLVAERDALVADVDRRTGDELPNGVLGFPAERATEVLVRWHWILEVDPR